MAWRCSGSSNYDLVMRLKSAGIISSERVVKAMTAVDRKKYCPRDPYQDRPQSIGYNATISAPHMHGYALQHLEPYLNPRAKVLDVGSGSGYLTACLAMMVQPGGIVVGIEHIDALVNSSIENVKSDHPELLTNGIVSLICGDGRVGYPSEGPYDCIHVGAAFAGHPAKLIEQLKSPGIMFIPVETYSGHQTVIIYEKDQQGVVHQHELMDVSYVPLTSKDSQLEKW